MSKFTKLVICAIVALLIIGTAFAGEARLVARQDEPSATPSGDATPEITPDATPDATPVATPVDGKAPTDGKAPNLPSSPAPSGSVPIASKIADAFSSATAGASTYPQPTGAPKYPTTGSGSSSTTPATTPKSGAAKIESGLFSVAAIASFGLFFL
ncbi:11329_t:CDS:2 [Funneliformis caledonium]|uniref:11329_t:CDS:1 n=1 Tax=Funneliformis caledonium TaxID=1117310 RepID=A0A9N8VAP2_9GLOM|nr:11329_t:CDS:2 [Funneliformis caledonium]